MNALSCPNAVSTTGADVLAAAARLRRERRGIAVRSCSCNRYSIEFVAGNEDVAQVVFQNEGQKLVVWLGYGPTVLLVVGYL